MRRFLVILILLSFSLSAMFVGPANAALTADQKKELKAIVQDAVKVGPLVAKKKYVEATAALQDVEERLATFMKEAGLKDTDAVLRSVQTQIEKVQAQLDRATGKGSAPFEKSVAGILAKKCVGCHGEDEAKADLRLDTFEGLEKGGRGGPLLIPGDGESSLLIQRLLTPDDNLRMPLGRDSLSEKEVMGIATWISEGAKFDGDKTAVMSVLAKSAAKAKPAADTKKTKTSKSKPEKSASTKESGNETVHFMKDIMPELVDTCGRCHNDKDRRSGFSVMSFEKLMKGGESGEVIVAGDVEGSRLWRLVNGDDTPVMPMGNQTGITRKWHKNLKTWIEEGAKFDGADPKKTFPTLQQREATALSQFTPEQWLERRKKSTDEDWKKTYPNTEANRFETNEFLLVGDVATDRLETIAKWADEQTRSLKQTFKLKEDILWQGKLAIFVFKDRFGYEEFNSSVHRREVPREVNGHAQVTATMEDAFVAMYDIGDATSQDSPGMQVNVMDTVSGAFILRGGKTPDWIVRGLGLALARQKIQGNAFLSQQPVLASKILSESALPDPTSIFEDGTFSPADVGPVGCTLVDFLLKKGSAPLFAQYVQKLQSDVKSEIAVKTVYKADIKTLVAAYANSLPAPGKKGKK